MLPLYRVYSLPPRWPGRVEVWEIEDERSDRAKAAETALDIEYLEGRLAVIRVIPPEWLRAIPQPAFMEEAEG